MKEYVKINNHLYNAKKFVVDYPHRSLSEIIKAEKELEYMNENYSDAYHLLKTVKDFMNLKNYHNELLARINTYLERIEGDENV